MCEGRFLISSKVGSLLFSSDIIDSSLIIIHAMVANFLVIFKTASLMSMSRFFVSPNATVFPVSLYYILVISCAHSFDYVFADLLTTVCFQREQLKVVTIITNGFEEIRVLIWTCSSLKIQKGYINLHSFVAVEILHVTQPEFCWAFMAAFLFL